MRSLLLSSVASSLLQVVTAVVSPHRYWRVLVVETHQVDDEIAGGQLYMYDTISTTAPDLTTGGTPIWGSSNSASDNGTFMFDGDELTKWFARPTDASTRWVGYDFGAGNAKAIIEFEWVNAQNAGDLHTPKVLTLQWSDNGTTWTTSFTQSDIVWDPDNIRLRVNAGNVYRPFVDPANKRYWRILMSRTTSVDGSWIASYAALQSAPGGAQLMIDSAKMIKRTANDVSPLLVNDDVTVGLGPISRIFPLAYVGYDFGVGANVSINAITLGKDGSGSSQYWYAPFLGYIQYSNDGRVWATDWEFMFPLPWSAGYVEQEVSKPPISPTPNGTPSTFAIPVTGPSSSAFAAKGVRFILYNDQMITKLRPRTTNAMTARVYLLEMLGNGGTVSKVLYDSQPLALAAGETLTIPPVYVKKNIHYAAIIQDPTGAPMLMDYKSVKYTSGGQGETRDFVRIDSATPIAAGLALDTAGAGPYCFDITYEGVS